MKNKKYLGIIALLLVVAMALSACSQGAGGEDGEDTPVTAEGVFGNFMKLEEPENNNPLGKVELISDTYGALVDAEGDLAIFYKESKDRLNNLTETYTLYSISEAKSLLTVTNAYPDEYGWENDFGHVTYPERLISGVWFDSVDDIVYMVVEWETRTPIDEETVEKEDLADSYIVDTYCDFYDCTGAFIATSKVVDECDSVASNDYCTLLSFGKTIGVFDEDGKLVRTYNGDVEATPTLYDWSTDKYDYLVVPNGITEESQMMSRTALEIYDKEGNLVREYVHGDYAAMANVAVLASGDVLIQQMVITDEIECDYFVGDMKLNVDTFLLDVETGKVTELTGFDYAIQDDVVFADDLADADEMVGGFVASENVRNIAGAMNLKTKQSCTIFFDNFGNVNFEFDYGIFREMTDDDYVIEVLDSEHMLVEISSGVTNRAILGKDGSLIAYVPEGATVLSDYIISGDSVYDFDMNKIYSVDGSWMNVLNKDDALIIYAEFGNCLAAAVSEEITGEGGEPVVNKYVIVYDVDNNSVTTYSDSSFYTYNTENIGIGGYLVIRKQGSDKSSYIVVAGDGTAVLTTPDCYGISTTRADDAYLVEVDIDYDIDGYERVYLITEASKNTEGGDDK